MKMKLTSQEQEIKRYNAEKKKWQRRKVRWDNWKKSQKSN